MNAQGQKTGGRQKGTPNKLTASMKYLTKALFLNNYDLLEQSFQQCKPAERLNFYAKMQPYLCARETSNDNGGEWTIGQNMEHQSIQQIELESLYQKLQNVELSYINALNNFQKTANERWNDIKEQMAAAQDYGVEQENLNKMFQTLFEQYTQQYEQNHARLDKSFEITRRDIQAKINEQEEMLATNPSPAENTLTTESNNLAADRTTQPAVSHTQHIDPHTAEDASPTTAAESSTSTVSPSTPAVDPPTPCTTSSGSSLADPQTRTDTHPSKPASGPHTQNHKQPQPRNPFYAKLIQKRKPRRSRK